MSYVVFHIAKCKKDDLTKMVPNFHTPSEISSAKQLVFKMLSVCLSNIIHKSGRNSVNRPAHEVEVHDIMETVDAIDFTTSSDLCCAMGQK